MGSGGALCGSQTEAWIWHTCQSLTFDLCFVLAVLDGKLRHIFFAPSWVIVHCNGCSESWFKKSRCLNLSSRAEQRMLLSTSCMWFGTTCSVPSIGERTGRYNHNKEGKRWEGVRRRGLFMAGDRQTGMEGKLYIPLKSGMQFSWRALWVCNIILHQRWIRIYADLTSRCAQTKCDDTTNFNLYSFHLFSSQFWKM